MELTNTDPFEPSLLLGTVAGVSPDRIRINLNKAGRITSTVMGGVRYGLGLVGEFVLIECEGNALFGRLIETRLPERERLTVEEKIGREHEVHPVGIVQLLATVSLVDLTVQPGVTNYPRLGARVFSAKHSFISEIPQRAQASQHDVPKVSLHVGWISDARNADVFIAPEKLFGRHCAILGSTGGGKSFTLAKFAQECVNASGKVILLDPSGEYHRLTESTRHVFLGTGQDKAVGSEECVVPYNEFTETDFLTLFQPAGKTQGPKLRAAIRSLKLAFLKPELSTEGVVIKANQPKKPLLDAEADPEIGQKLDSPFSTFDVTRLPRQIWEECVWETGKDANTWGAYDAASQSYCLTLVTRINGLLQAPELRCIFYPSEKQLLFTVIDDYLSSKDRLLRISLEHLSFEFNAREIIANVIGRRLLLLARCGRFKELPLVIFLDEAHQFFNKSVGSDEFASRLDAFELLAKEGRKFGVNLCLSTQRPRDIPEGVLSQMGTLVVHRLTNDRDREIVERACGDIDRSASAFLPNLEPGECAIIGVDIPIPLTVKVQEPIQKPDSRGPDYQRYWIKK
jgi:hypothetical protein